MCISHSVMEGQRVAARCGMVWRGDLMWCEQCCSKSCRRTTRSDAERCPRRHFATCSAVAATRSWTVSSSQTPSPVAAAAARTPLPAAAHRPPPTPDSSPPTSVPALPRRRWDLLPCLCPVPTTTIPRTTVISRPNPSDLPFSLIPVRFG